VCFGVVGKILMRAGFNGIYLVRFGFRMWGAIDFEVISASEIFKINSQKTRFWKEKSVENVVTTLGPTALCGGFALSSVMMLVCRETLPDCNLGAVLLILG
jgi:hypothetical protein